MEPVRTKSLSLQEIEQTTEYRKRWFKKEWLAKKCWHWFVVDKKIKVDQKKGLPQTTMVGNWRDLLFILKKFVTEEGCYTLEFVYHLQLMLHFEAGKLINFPHFLLKSLERRKKCAEWKCKPGCKQTFPSWTHYDVGQEEVRKKGNKVGGISKRIPRKGCRRVFQHQYM